MALAVFLEMTAAVAGAVEKSRSVRTVKIQFRSVRLVRRNAVPFFAAGTLNLALNSWM